MINLRRTFMPLAIAASTVLAGCTTTKIVEKPVCDEKCQKTAQVEGMLNPLLLLRDKNGALPASAAAMILRTRAKADPASQKMLDDMLGKNGLGVDNKKTASCLTQEQPNGVVLFNCPEF